MGAGSFWFCSDLPTAWPDSFASFHSYVAKYAWPWKHMVHFDLFTSQCPVFLFIDYWLVDVGQCALCCHRLSITNSYLNPIQQLVTDEVALFSSCWKRTTFGAGRKLTAHVYWLVTFWPQFSLVQVSTANVTSPINSNLKEEGIVFLQSFLSGTKVKLRY